MTEANGAYQQGRSAQAEIICRQILTRVPAHAIALNLLGLINQSSGRHKAAIKMFAKAIAADDLDAACHYNIASSYQLLGQGEAAARHFKAAIALGMSGQKHVEEFVMQNRIVLDCISRIMSDEGLTATKQDLIGVRDIAAIASDIFIRSALESTTFRSVPLEAFLTHLRAALLRVANARMLAPAADDDHVVVLFCALAQQCFINEYVFVQSDVETQYAGALRNLLLQKLSAGTAISPLLLAAVAAYFPLHSLPEAKSLLAVQWPPVVNDILRQQLREPLEEADDRRALPALTAVDDGISVQVMQQYEENPYPRWTVIPLAVLAGDLKRQPEAANESVPSREILIAGCGTGQHPVTLAQYSSDARILAVDISRASLAYARRKTREAGLRNIEYAQADILKLGSIGRTFDLIEAVGVLHHLADPKAGWRVLLSLLKPDGIMRIGLYSEIARRSVVDARALIAERGYGATAEDIRVLRQFMIRDGNELRWKPLIRSGDFYSISGCRDMLFNVMEHRLTIPEIAAFLNENELSFLGFEFDDEVIPKFQLQYPGADALTNLDDWNAFEVANPQTFAKMYVFTVCKKARAPD